MGKIRIEIPYRELVELDLRPLRSVAERNFLKAHGIDPSHEFHYYHNDIKDVVVVFQEIEETG